MARMLYMVAGEHSGDTRGAELMGALRKRRPGWAFRGLGGPKMKRLADGAVEDWVDRAAVVGVWEVLRHYSFFKARFEQTRREIEKLRPDAVVFVDYPGFNLRLARALHEAKAGARLIYYISPQVWAWNRGRIPRMAEWLDLMICLFPFEVELFEAAGLRSVCAGHPIVDQLERERIESGREPKLVGLFPGSREREVARLFPLMVETAAVLHGRHPEWRFEASAASESLRARMDELLARNGAGELPVEIVTGKSHELMQRARAGVVASGTATLEAAYYGLPYCLVYKISWPTYLVGRALVEIGHLGMANILAGREIVHEFIQHDANVANLVSFVESVMTDEVRRAELERNLRESAAMLGTGGAATVAAEAVLGLLDGDGDGD